MSRDAHADLVARAAVWLTTRGKCVLVLSEPQCWAVSEFPDAIGWRTGGYSIMVECKTSRADFRRDAHKPSKHYAKAIGRETMGDERWFLAPAGVLQVSDIPEGYGLLELHGQRIRVAQQAAKLPRPGTDDAELPLLIWATRKQAWIGGYSGDHVRLALSGKGGKKRPPVGEPLGDMSDEQTEGD